MKRIALLIGGLMLVMSFSSCDKIKDLFSSDDDSSNDPNVIGGDANITLAQVGNEFSTSSVNIGGTYYSDIVQPVTITKNDNGIVTVKLVADLSKVPALAVLNNYFPSSMKDASGRLSTEVQFKVTSEGIQDSFNPDKQLHTMVKYDCNVGDQYPLTGSDGVTITRTVTTKSTTDDFSYGLMLIKATTIEQNSRIPGVQKIIYKANHKFGLVFMQLVPESGSSGSMYVYPTNY
jgi:hypothetical protein